MRSPLTLDVLRIDEPCHAAWDDMAGDAQKRFCQSCGKHVHDAEQLTDGQVRSLLAGDDAAGICLRLRHAADGTVVTRDTPRPNPWTGRLRRLAACVAAMVVAQPLAGCVTGAVRQRPADTDSKAADLQTLGRPAAPALLGEAVYEPDAEG